MSIASRSCSSSRENIAMDLNTSETPALANMNADDLDEISGEAWEEYDPTDLVLISQLLVPPLSPHPPALG
jgi:hypothetical protein